MAVYRVNAKETVFYHGYVTAESEQEAKEKAETGNVEWGAENDDSIDFDILEVFEVGIE